MERDAQQMVGDLRPAFEEGRGQTDPLEYIEVLRDRRAINERFAELQAHVKREILVFTKPPYAKPPQENVEGLEVSQTHEARSLYEFSVFDDPLVMRGVQRFVAAGEQARFVASLPLKLVIIDETIVMFGMEDPVAGCVRGDDRRRRAPIAGARAEDGVRGDLADRPDVGAGVRPAWSPRRRRADAHAVLGSCDDRLPASSSPPASALASAAASCWRRIDGRPMLQHVLELAAAVELAPVVVVLGTDADALLAACQWRDEVRIDQPAARGGPVRLGPARSRRRSPVARPSASWSCSATSRD